MSAVSGSVSVVIPFLEETDLVLEALESVAGQSLLPSEVILVCNQKDAVFPSIRPDLPFPVRLVHEPVRGSAHARNAGLTVATGGWIQFLDVDDLLLPEKFEKQTTTQADVVLSPQMYYKMNGTIVDSKWQPEDIWVGLLDSGLGATSAWLFRRTAILDTGGWKLDQHSHQEYELLFRLMQAGATVTLVEEPLTIVRQRISGSITSMTASTRPWEGLKLREAMRNYLLESHLLNDAREAAFHRYIFGQLRGIHRHDPSKGKEVYQQYFAGKNFTPVDTDIPGYQWLYRIFGFVLTEKMMLYASRLRRRFSR